MPALTDELIHQLRGDIGDTDTDFIIGASEIQRMYVRANGDYEVMLVYALRRMKAYYAKAGDLPDGQGNPTFERYSQMLADVERSTGMSGGKLTVTSLKLNLNFSEADLQNGDSTWNY